MQESENYTLNPERAKEIINSEPAILLVSNKFDPHVDIIVKSLSERHIPFVRFNTEDFPLRSSITILFEGINHSEELMFPNNPTIKGYDITAVWYRRPAPFEFPSEFSPAAHIFANNESTSTIRGLWRLLDCIWVNDPDSNRAAELKLNQLKTASQLGLEIPKTIVTNNPEDAKKFFSKAPGNIIIKSLSGGLVGDNADSKAIYTNILGAEDMKDVDDIRHTPVLLQEYVPKDVELRITVVGNEVFTAEIHSQTKDKTLHDWRRDILSLEHREHKLPQEIQQKCKSLVKSFGLNFGAIDMILTPDGRYVFLEINPNGQWAWVEELTGLINPRVAIIKRSY